MEQVNYEALRLKEKLEDTIETLKDLQKQIGLLGLKEHFASTKQETRRHSTSLVDESDVFGHPELEEVGKQIAAKCKGLHLALKTLAGIRFESEVEGWKRILRSETWDLSNNDILPAVMLSYNELPPHLKPCFSYCAIFPKDYPFRNKLFICGLLMVL
ncbi:hypothetical protein T459_33343 [Capsicum annuum]|uniref:NB-ARC domain-containing protein n=1 Tax=Capsicum annuum TaxID=4072 RepID=A0A2G2XZB4_CAPAN|nr:hypothetical protein T459_33343 [Capsicum annuum]